MTTYAVVTGVAGGIGRAIAKTFAEAGYYVIGVDRAEVEPPVGCARFLRLDVSEPQTSQRLFDEIAGKAGQVDVLVNNAAIAVYKTLVETLPEEWDAVFASNLRSIYLAIRTLYPLMHRGSAIINVGSVHAIATSAGIAAYAASKGALLALTRALALELGPEGIRVNTVLPGATDTPMLHAGVTRGRPSGTSVADALEALGRRHPLGRIGEPTEIAAAVLFLTDNRRSSFITGQSLVVDGGALARLSTE